MSWPEEKLPPAPRRITRPMVLTAAADAVDMFLERLDHLLGQSVERLRAIQGQVRRAILVLTRYEVLI